MRAQFNAWVEKRREKAWTNFTRDLRHRRHKCLTRNSVTYSVLVMRVYVQFKLLSASARCLNEERGENPGQETAQAIVQSDATRSRWRGIAWHVMTNATNTSSPLSHGTWKAYPRILLSCCVFTFCSHAYFLANKAGIYVYRRLPFNFSALQLSRLVQLSYTSARMSASLSSDPISLV